MDKNTQLDQRIAELAAELHELELYRWCADMRVHLSEDAAGYWCVIDVVGDVIGKGQTTIVAMESARKAVEGE